MDDASGPGPIKKDALFYGMVLAFIAFVLMLVFLGYAMIQSRAVGRRAAEMVSEPAAAVQVDRRDYSGLRIATGDDGARMVLVPSGPFLMGSPPVEGDQDETPQRGVYVDAFWIDLYEVTFGQYAEIGRAHV